MTLKTLSIVILMFLTGGVRMLYGQISPGELSKAHQNLEGISQCTRCHETGEELSNTKCLDCHREIKIQTEKKYGFHFANAQSNCVTCHKEHLGKEAKITKFTPGDFDHTKTGFTLSGKHTSLKCDQCHTERLIKVPEVITTLKSNPRHTYLGLDRKCISCHTDRHQGSAGVECQSCHGTHAWSPAASFDHAKTKFRLHGKHVAVECGKCHSAMKSTGIKQPVLFTTKAFSDCSPCHQSPHRTQFSGKECQSCHNAEAWNVVTAFDHSKTKFALPGKHAAVACEKCHTQMKDRKNASVSFVTKAYTDCTPCHTSPHREKITQLSCTSCHTPASWNYSAATRFDHSLTQYALQGKHAELQCEQCHKPRVNSSFKEKYFLPCKNCTDCHADYHDNQFTEKYTSNCALCHSLKAFKPASFGVKAHAETRFPLTGAHAALACNGCHEERNINGKRKVKYGGISIECQSCHLDVHDGQFIRDGATQCVTCHSTLEWHSLIFKHDVQSTFPLTGAHSTIPCNRCHKQESSGVKTIVRYKPLSGKCESCHQKAK